MLTSHDRLLSTVLFTRDSDKATDNTDRRTCKVIKGCVFLPLLQQSTPSFTSHTESLPVTRRLFLPCHFTAHPDSPHAHGVMARAIPENGGSPFLHPTNTSYTIVKPGKVIQGYVFLSLS